MKGLRVIILFCMLALLSLIGCTGPHSPVGSGPSFSAHDPDGDGDTTGAGHFPTTRPATVNKVFIFEPRYH